MGECEKSRAHNVSFCWLFLGGMRGRGRKGLTSPPVTDGCLNASLVTVGLNDDVLQNSNTVESANANQRDATAEFLELHLGKDAQRGERFKHTP
jgi:hypothetical protein